MREVLKLEIPLKDEDFDKIYPPDIRRLSKRHFTPVNVARKAAEWLNEFEEKKKLLDVGCGVGKFCFVAGSLTNHAITGIDYRENYIYLCKSLCERYGIKNLDFIQQNILDVNFKDYDTFYFFNSFLEQIDETAHLDEEYETSFFLYNIYVTHLRKQFFAMPAGTNIITYHVLNDQIPANYSLVKSDFDGLLKMWNKH
jgi:SAM-dependent methyltransferase